jgi:hypothetical protein
MYVPELEQADAAAQVRMPIAVLPSSVSRKLHAMPCHMPQCCCQGADLAALLLLRMQLRCQVDEGEGLLAPIFEAAEAAIAAARSSRADLQPPVPTNAEAISNATASAPQQNEGDVLQAPVLQPTRPATRSARAALQQAMLVSTVPVAGRTRSTAPVPAPTLESMQKFLHTLLADPLKEARVMGSNAKLVNSRVAGEAIAESDIDVRSFMVSYDQAGDAQAAAFLLGCHGALKACGRHQLKELIELIKQTGNLQNC